LAAVAALLWPKEDAHGAPYIVFTGGEPLLQLDEDLLDECLKMGFETAVETNGTIDAPRGLDWICVSPKPGAQVKQKRGNELKLLYPLPLDPADYLDWDFEEFFLQPIDDQNRRENIRKTLAYCALHPRWRVSMQLHKLLGVP
jgi:organic radical activating enzyme